MQLGARPGGWGTMQAAGSNRQHVIAYVLVCLAALKLIACDTAALHQPSHPVVAQPPHVLLQAPLAAVREDQRDRAPMRLLIPRIGLNAGILALGPAANG